MSSGDYSRNTFDPTRDFGSVLMQQGRVQLDADWNELMAILDRRFRAETIDILGRCAAPVDAISGVSEGFKIQFLQASNTFTIGRGRIYVDGLLAENHGTESSRLGPQEFDPILMELRATDSPTSYNHQPYYPNPDPLPSAGTPYVFYLDVWQREVTYLEQPDLVEKAVGVDTTTRLQTAWQVKVLKTPSAKDSASLERDAAWMALIAPSAGRLTTGTAAVTGQDDPCVIPPAGGYRGLENCLYRVEIHAIDNQGVAFFKWSRDNGSVEAAVDAIDGGTLTVEHTGRDDVLRFSPGDWVEITDDWREFARKAGDIAKVQDVIEAKRQIVLSVVALSPDLIPSGKGIDTYAHRHTRVRRWDQSGVVRKADGTVYVDLDATASTRAYPGIVPVTPDGTSIVLENGVTVAFDLDPKVPEGKFQVGDYWIFAARTPDASVELLKSAPPRGIHHHYAFLACVDANGKLHDCRKHWPAAATGQRDCCCTVCVEPGDITPSKSLQVFLDEHSNRGPVTICLRPGNYALTAPLMLGRQHSGLTLRGCQKGVKIHAASGFEHNFRDGLVVVMEAGHVMLQGLTFNLPVARFGAHGGELANVRPLVLGTLGGPSPSAQKNLCAAIGVRPVDCTALTIRDCTFFYDDALASMSETQNLFAVGVFAGGALDQLTLLDNEFVVDAPSSNVQISSEPFQVCVGWVVAPSTVVQISPNVLELAAKNKNQKLPALRRAAVDLTLAGTVIPASITEGLCRDNSFVGLAAAGLIYAQTGALRIEENRAKQCYSGFWLLGRRSSPDPDSIKSVDQNQTRIKPLTAAKHLLFDPVLETAGAIAKTYPLPAAFSGSTISLSNVSTKLAAPALPYGPLFTFDVLNQLAAAMESAASKAANNRALGQSLSLLISNNHIDARVADVSLGVSGPGLVVWGDETDAQTEAIISGNRIGNNTNFDSMSRSISTVTLFNISSCALCCNIFCNEGRSTPGTLLAPAGPMAECTSASPSQPPTLYQRLIKPLLARMFRPTAQVAASSGRTSTGRPSTKSPPP